MSWKFVFEQILYVVKELFSLITNPYIICFVLILGVVFLIIVSNYKKTTYYKITKTPYLKLLGDTGRLGEYMIYKNLRRFESSGAKFLFNVYIPKENGETSEIDVLMLCSNGIFVFESKNYSGWIFGSEKNHKWTQTLPQGRGRSHKESFYNPIMQNQYHIKHLRAFLNDDNIPMYSIIVFSDRCTFKNLTVTSEEIKVINRYRVELTVASIYNKFTQSVLSNDNITHIYNLLYPFTQVDEDLKQKHIENIKNDISSDDSLPKQQINENIEAEANLDFENKKVEEIILKCPKCGGELIERVAKRGQNKGKNFYGCSNFPKCKYMQNN